VKIVYAPPFEPVVWSRSILGLGLPSSADGNCECPLPVHWNCLFVSNQGAFNFTFRHKVRAPLAKYWVAGVAMVVGHARRAGQRDDDVVAGLT